MGCRAVASLLALATATVLATSLCGVEAGAYLQLPSWDEAGARDDYLGTYLLRAPYYHEAMLYVSVCGNAGAEPTPSRDSHCGRYPRNSQWHRRTAPAFSVYLYQELAVSGGLPDSSTPAIHILAITSVAVSLLLSRLPKIILSSI